MLICPLLQDLVGQQIIFAADGQGRDAQPELAARTAERLLRGRLRVGGGDRALTMYFDGAKVRYVRSEGPDIDTQMKEGVITSAGHWATLWQWLAG